MLGLNCTIDRLFLRFGPDGLCYQVEPVLSPTRPRHLEFSQGWPGDLSGPAGRVFDVFRGAGGSRLESLHCRIGLGRKHGDVDFSAVMEGLRASLSCTPLQELKATISLENLDTQPRAGALLKLSRLQVGLRATPPPPDPADCPLCPAEHSAAAFDLRAWMCDLIKAIVTIHKAEVILEGPRGRWRRTSFASGQVQYEEKA
ncbi:hypothetical protein NUW54_g10161 [Trametes sanguinea]|uniref:Uncharacterized protein n=1 Tax=Trametes sanguinea TaxID=158606 RepID=A0ACC1P2A3_9APHY|nr:hypothetical protein NUW54_g10161 [Trametes sanguinea]